MAGFYSKTGITISDSITEGLMEIAPRVREAATLAAKAGAEIIRERAYEYANVSKGYFGNGIGGEHMRDEIKVETRDQANGVTARVQIDMNVIPYAAHQEFGPHGNAFMRRALDETRPDVHARIREVYTAEMGANGKVRTAVRFRAIA